METLKIVNGNTYVGKEKINDKIFYEELFDYKVIDREEFIDTLIGWISECETSDKELMKSDLKMLMSLDDEFIFSSISTNYYIGVNDKDFEETCKELIELNQNLQK